MLNTMSPKKSMKPTPSALKWLAEKRARVAFDLQFNLTLLNELRPLHNLADHPAEARIMLILSRFA